MAILLRLLVQLHQSAELKLDLHHEMEVLRKSLDLDFEPIDILRDRSQEFAPRKAQVAEQA